MRTTVSLNDALLRVYKKLKATRESWYSYDFMDGIPPEVVRRTLKQVLLEQYDWPPEDVEREVTKIEYVTEWSKFCTHLRDIPVADLAKRPFEVQEVWIRPPLSPRKPRRSTILWRG